MTNAKKYPSNFSYQESCWEGRHTSTTWQDSKPNMKITGETKSFYFIVDAYGFDKKIKKEKISFLSATEIRNKEIDSQK